MCMSMSESVGSMGDCLRKLKKYKISSYKINKNYPVKEVFVKFKPTGEV